MNKLVNYPIHNHAIRQNDYTVKVRALGQDDWEEVGIYQVKVDMHDVRTASMVYFDFEGEVEVEISGPYYIYQVDIRPISKSISHTCDTKVLRFSLSEPSNLSIELNKDRYHNLHLFAGKIDDDIPDKNSENTVVISGDLSGFNTISEDTFNELEKMPKGRTVYIEAGMHYVLESTLRLPSNTNIYLEGGAIIVGAFICSDVENIRIYGRGLFYLADFSRFGGINGIRISHSSNIQVEDVMFINPPHYTVHLGGSKDSLIRNIKAFSCEGWSDGIDIMSSQNILVDGGFLRNSDDCIAIYGRRWSYNGDSKNILVKNLSVWADVAHPLNIGCHGDYDKDGNIIKDIHFMNIDILEHNEHQPDYLGCMAINVGDKNTVMNITYENIRVEPFIHGKLLDFQVTFNPKYNPAPGKRIENIVLKNIYYQGHGEVTSIIKGHNEEFVVDGIHLQDVWINAKKVISLQEANIEVAEFAYNVTIE